jgi:hypothetical protein
VEDVLTDQLRAEQAVVVAYDGLAAEGVAALQARARERAGLLEAALPSGRPAVDPPSPPLTPALDYALEAERHALRVHVAGVGQVRDRDTRALLADLVAGSARSEAALLTLLDRPPAPSAFPGQPLR